MLVFLVGIFGRLGIMAYYFIYVLGNPALMAGVSTVMSLGMFTVNVYAPFLLNRFDKKWVGVGSALAQTLCCVIFFFAGECHLNGVIYSCISFAAKFGNAIGGSAGILVLAQVGFVANADLSASVLTNMNAVINFGPAVFFVIAGLLFAMNGMTNRLGKENEKKICAQMEKTEQCY